MRTASPLPAALDGRPFKVATALAEGASPAMLRRASLRTPMSGLRVPATNPAAAATADDDDDLASTCVAALVIFPESVAFSHVTALRLHGVELPWRVAPDERIHVVVPRRGERPDRSGVVAHFSGRPDLEVTVRSGLPVTSVPQTWLHVAGSLTVDDLVILGDAMLRRTAPLTTIEGLRRLAAGAYRLRGIARARPALDLIRPGTDSSMETRARLVLTAAGLPCPAVNVPVHAASGEFLAIPDMSYPELKIAIEHDGDHHRTDPVTWRRDVERRQKLEGDGWLIITSTADDVIRFPERFAARVRRAVRSRS